MFTRDLNSFRENLKYVVFFNGSFYFFFSIFFSLFALLRKFFLLPRKDLSFSAFILNKNVLIDRSASVKDSKIDII